MALGVGVNMAFLKKIKKLGFVGALILTPLALFAARGPMVVEAPFDICTAPFSVSVSSFAWTAVPSSNCTGRTGIFINSLSTNIGMTRCIPSATSATPSLSTSTYAVWCILPVASAEKIEARDSVYIFCVTTNTAGSETVSGVEYKQ